MAHVPSNDAIDCQAKIFYDADDADKWRIRYRTSPQRSIFFTLWLYWYTLKKSIFLHNCKVSTNFIDTSDCTI